VDAWLRTAGDALKRPGVQLVVGAFVIALAFPGGVAGSLALAILAGGAGVGIAKAWGHAPAWVRTPPDQITRALVIAVIAALGIVTF